MKDSQDSKKVGIGRREFLKYSIAGAAMTVGSLQGPWIIGARGEQPIKIGQTQPLTGPFGAKGANQADGTKLAAEEINAKGGVLGRKLEIVTADTESRPGPGKQKAVRLIEQEKVGFLTGCVSSAVGAAILAVALEKKTPFFIQLNYATTLTNQLCNRYTFRMCPNDTMWPRATVPWMLENLGKKWYFQVADYIAGKDGFTAGKEIIEKKGGKVVGVDFNPLGTTDFSTQLMKVKAAKPEVIGILEWGSDNTNLLKQISEFGLDKEMEIAGCTGVGIEDCVGVAPGQLGHWGIEWYHDIDIPKSKKFVGNYKSKYGIEPTKHSWIGYVTLQQIAGAIERAKSTDARKVVEAFEGHEFDNLTGRPAYMRDWDHQGIMDILIIKSKPISEQQKEGPLDLFEMATWVSGESVAQTREECLCKMGSF
jgi:branched-chain amino acid transport system substrate-binding protein